MTDALNRNAAAAAAPDAALSSASRKDPSPSRRLSLRQELIVNEYANYYDIARDQISFEGDSDTPFFHFEALSRIVTELSNFTEIAVRETAIEPSRNYVTCEASITLKDGRIVRSFGSAFVGESLQGGAGVDDLQTALDVARARGLRSALRMVGFDPVRAHEAAKRGESLYPKPQPEDEARQRDLAQIHIIATEAGVLEPQNDERYRKLIATFFPECTSAAELDAAQRSQFIAILRGIKSARESVLVNDPKAKGWVADVLRGAHGSP